jgi:hypothetical protein
MKEKSHGNTHSTESFRLNEQPHRYLPVRAVSKAVRRLGESPPPRFAPMEPFRLRGTSDGKRFGDETHHVKERSAEPVSRSPGDACCIINYNYNTASFL